MSFDALQALADAGNPVDMLTDDQKQAFAQLSEHEIEVITTVQAKLASVSAEVEGQDFNIVRIG